ncbi:hypothetical protein N7492_000162 [Penicillium capsulatum]|uniref:Rhodopsin domain-containing protein n=1 Tax=Penicillium capsulatum TaxID=69766 RepID=A0A9W9LYA3_9EURO|nr:hypothetical protein N7492_000162 [Penicillium capsulatum]KAJ6130773.1 hypothetical protein N7512_003553 [Penicillium capsulatum]
MGWVHNLHESDPNSQIPRVIAISLVFSIVAFLAVCLRFYVRFHTRRVPWYDDYSALLGSLLTLAYASIMIAQTRWGQGLTARYLPPENVEMFSKIQYAGGPVYTLDLLFFKLALLTSYLRIGGFVSTYRKIIVGVIAAVVLNQLICTLVMCLVCLPVAKQWNPNLDGRCLNQVQFYYGLAGTSIGFDVMIIILPLPVLWRLRLGLKEKVVLTFIFVLGFFVTIIQIIRILSVKNLKTYTDSKDLILWSIIEVSLGAIISCIPTYGPLFKAFASTVSSYRHRSNPTSYPLTATPRGATPAPKSKSGNTKGVDQDDIQTETLVTSSQDTWNGGSDADSARHILHEPGPLHIQTRTEVTVERD